MLTRAKAAISFVDLTDSGINDEVRKKTVVKRKRRKKADGGSSNVEEEESHRSRGSQPVRIMTRNRRRSQLPDHSCVDSDVIIVDGSSQESSSSYIVGLSCLNNSGAKAPPGRAKRQRSLDFQKKSLQKRRKSTSTSSDSSSEIQIIHERIMMMPSSPMNLDGGTVSTDVETVGSFESDESVIIEVVGQSEDANLEEVIQDTAKTSQGPVKVEVSDEPTVKFGKFRAGKVLLRSQDSGLKCANKPLKIMGDEGSSREEVRAAGSVEPDVVMQRSMQELVSDRNMQDLVTDRNMQDLVTDRNMQDLVTDRNLQDLVPDRNMQDLVPDGNMQDLVPGRKIKKLVADRNMEDFVPDRNMQDNGLREADQDLMIDSEANSQQIVKEKDFTPEMGNSTVSSKDSNFDKPTSYEDKPEKSSSEQEPSSPKVFVINDSVTLSLSPPEIGDCIEHPKQQIDDGPSAESKLNVVTIADQDRATEDNGTTVKASENQSKESSNESENTHAQQAYINGRNDNVESNAEHQSSAAESNENFMVESEMLSSETSDLPADESAAVENSVAVVTHPLPDERQDSEMEVGETTAMSIQSVSFPMKNIIKCEPWTSAVYDISNFEFTNGVQDERKIECVDLDDSSESTNAQASQLQAPSSSSKVLQAGTADSGCFHNNESSIKRRHSQELAVPVPITKTIIHSSEGASSGPPTFQGARIGADESRNDNSSVTAVIVTHHSHPVPRQRRIYDRNVDKEFNCPNCSRQYRLLHAFKVHLLKCCPHVLPLDLPLTRVELRTKKLMFSPENIAKAMAELQSTRPLLDSHRNPRSNDGSSFAKKRRRHPSSEETSQCNQQAGSCENTQDLSGSASSIQGNQTSCGGGGTFKESSSSENLSIISVASAVPIPEAQEVPVPLVASEVEVALIEDTNPSQKLHPGSLIEFHERPNIPAESNIPVERNVPVESNIEIPTASQLHEMYMTLHHNFPPVAFEAIYPDETPEENLSYILLSLEVVDPCGMYYNRRTQTVATIMEKWKCAAALKASQQQRSGKELKRVGQKCKSTIRVIRPIMQQVSQSNRQKFSQPTSSSQANSLNLRLH